MGINLQKYLENRIRPILIKPKKITFLVSVTLVLMYLIFTPIGAFVVNICLYFDVYQITPHSSVFDYFKEGFIYISSIQFVLSTGAIYGLFFLNYFGKPAIEECKIEL
jgi:hypothetical protein